MKAAIRVVLLSEVNSKFGAPFLNELVAHQDVEVAGLITTPEGRLCDYYVGEPDAVDLTEQAGRLGLPVLRPRDVNAPEVLAALRRLDPDYLLIANYQQILRAPLLELPKEAVVNFHPSPLPRYAGLAPFFWMAYHGERESGVSAIIAAPAVDEGPVLASRPVELTGQQTAGEIRDVLFAESRRLLHEVIPRLVVRDLASTPQDMRFRTYFSRPKASEIELDWSWPLERLMCVVRACSPLPGAIAQTEEATLRIHAGEPVPPGRLPVPRPGRMLLDAELGLVVGCADGWLRIVTLSCLPARPPVPGGGPGDRREEVLPSVNVAAVLAQAS